MRNDTTLCKTCFLRIPIAAWSEHMEAVHGRCGNRGCERRLVDGQCPTCDDGTEPDSNRTLGL